MSLKRRVGLALLGFAACAPFAAAHAANLIVVEARGVALKPGQTIDDTKPLMLKEGQHVTLIAPTGATFKLDGPYNKAPAADQGAVPIGTRLAALITQNQARTGEVGTTRGTAPLVKLPNPWLFDISRNGTVCLEEGKAPVFWRPDVAKAGTLSVQPADKSWKAQANWPAGTDRITVATNVPIHGDATYLVALDGNETALAVSSVPAVLNNDSMRAAWMVEKGCDAQAEALLKPAS